MPSPLSVKLDDVGRRGGSGGSGESTAMASDRQIPKSTSRGANGITLFKEETLTVLGGRGRSSADQWSMSDVFNAMARTETATHPYFFSG